MADERLGEMEPADKACVMCDAPAVISYDGQWLCSTCYRDMKDEEDDRSLGLDR